MMYLLLLFVVFSFVAIVESSWDNELIREEIRDRSPELKPCERNNDEDYQM